MIASRTAALPEAALYGPVKALLEAQGYDVKGEIVRCGVGSVGTRCYIALFRGPAGGPARPPGEDWDLSRGP